MLRSCVIGGHERKEVNDMRLDNLLAEKGADGWELAYARKGKQTRVSSDSDWWELIFKRPKSEKPVGPCIPVVAFQPVTPAPAPPMVADK